VMMLAAVCRVHGGVIGGVTQSLLCGAYGI
jgi:hypothetical protein